MRRVRRLDRRQRLEPVPLQDEAIYSRLPTLDPARCAEELHAVDGAGRIFRGARAVAAILRSLGRGWWIFGALLGYPPVVWPAGLAYRLVARHRHRLGPKGGACALPPPGSQ